MHKQNILIYFFKTLIIMIKEQIQIHNSNSNIWICFNSSLQKKNNTGTNNQLQNFILIENFIQKKFMIIVMMLRV